MSANLLVRIGAGALAAAVLLVVVVRCGAGGSAPADRAPPAAEALSEDSARLAGVEGDTAEDTLRTLVAEVRRFQDELAELKTENERVLARNRELAGMETRILREVDRGAETRGRTVDERVRAQLARQRDEFARARAAVEGLVDRVPAAASPADPGGDYVWTAGGFGTPPGEGRLEKLLAAEQNLIVTEDAKDGGCAEDARCPEKVYTVPRNSVLTGATVLSGLIGRVPNGDAVVDPYPFKLMVGPRNLIANGWEIPDVRHAVVSGIALGDWTLSCVRGSVTSVTFVFADGRIVTLPEPGTPDAVADRPAEWAWLSDEVGHPCVPGERVTNARRYLLQMMGAETVAAVGAAFAEAQTVRHRAVGPQGATSVAEVRDGAAGDYALGRAATTVMGEFTRYMRSRLEREVGRGLRRPRHRRLRAPRDGAPDRLPLRRAQGALRGGGPVRRRAGRGPGLTMAAGCGRPRRVRCVRRAANGGAVDRARRRWRMGAMALAVLAALASLALSGTAALCLFAAGVVIGRLIEGLRHPPRGMRIRLGRKGRRRT